MYLDKTINPIYTTNARIYIYAWKEDRSIIMFMVTHVAWEDGGLPVTRQDPIL
jgi:hypothetical protein